MAAEPGRAGGAGPNRMTPGAAYAWASVSSAPKTCRVAHCLGRRGESLDAVALREPEVDRQPEIADVDDVECVAQRARLEQRLRHEAEAQAVGDALQLHVARVGIERDAQRQPLRVERALQARTESASIGVQDPAALVQLGEPVAAPRARAARGHHGQPRADQPLAAHVGRQRRVARHEHQRRVELAERELVEHRAGPAGFDARRDGRPALTQHAHEPPGSISSPMPCVSPSRNAPAGGSVALTISRSASTSRRIARHWSCTRQPRSVGRGGLVLRSSNSMPSASSRFCTRRVMAGCVIPSSVAAWLRDWQCTTCANASISPIFMLFLHGIR